MGSQEPQKQAISIHAPARGATRVAPVSDPSIDHFNPRSREGSDLQKGQAVLHVLLISIHAPARGATLSDWKKKAEDAEFQSTLPRGERPTDILVFVLSIDFNPRSREGSDGYHRCQLINSFISIHAPARGATVLYFNNDDSYIFQSTLPRGERRICRRKRTQV